MKPNNHRILALVLLVLFVALPFLAFSLAETVKALKEIAAKNVPRDSLK